MPKQQRAVRFEQKNQMQAMQRLEQLNDEELAAETRYRSAAQAILGARAAEKYDAGTAREHFRKAVAAARPQERMQIRRMADASLALAERRAGDLKLATAKLGVESPTGRQLFGLRVIGIVAPPSSAGVIARVRGVVAGVAALVGIFAIGFGIIFGISQAFGGLAVELAIFYGCLLVLVVAGVLAYFGRRRQKAARTKRREELAARAGH